MNKYDVSVAVLTYNPDQYKLLATLRSILLQKNIRLQIVIADDGSKEVDFSAADALFAANNFVDYVYVRNETNRGTVYNALSAIEQCTGSYVKPISPGDLLGGETVLADWLAAATQADASWSFCDVVSYTPDGQDLKLTRTNAHPLTVACYQNGDTKEARWNYLIYNDLILGAATLCRRELLLQYVKEIAGKVIYAEDNAYRLMMYDHIIPHYFACEALVYEHGTGVSTSGNSVWAQRLTADWNACDQMLFARDSHTALDRAMRLAAKGKYCKLAVKLLHVIGNSNARKYRDERKHRTRQTGSALPLEFLKRCALQTDKEV